MKRKFKFSAVLVGILMLASVLVWSGDQPATPKIGETAPDFTLTNQNGEKVSLSDYSGKTVVLEWTNPDCPFVVRHYKQETMKKISAKYEDVVWLAINSTNNADTQSNKKWVESQKLDYQVLGDHQGVVGHIYGAKTTPHMFIVDKGVLVYNGAIDDDPRGQGASINYVEQALAQIKAGEPITKSSTKPYGCSVKYLNTN